MSDPLQDDSPASPLQALPTAASSMNPPKTRQIPHRIESLPMSASEYSLPLRRSNPQAASLYASTLSPPGSRPMSPAGRGSPTRVLSGTVFDAPTNKALSDAAGDNPADPLNIILKAFVPHVSVYASEDTETFIREKGFKNGLWELLRPFGEKIQGKVSVRDSHGVSKVKEDFCICFTRFGENIEHPDQSTPGLKNAQPAQGQNGAQGSANRDRAILNNVETVVEKHLSYAEDVFMSTPDHMHPARAGLDIENASPYYSLFLRRLLSGLPITPHETFAHPVACIIAISSRSETPIETLRQLYNETSQGEKRLPPWVDADYLRYYVLVHDEENDDITRSMGLFEQMKRHLGLHCHLLRIRSSQTAETDDDSIPLPACEWVSALEELTEIQRSDNEHDFEDSTPYILESDATAIRTFIREMVTQSIIPTMERHMSIWNDQVASRRRGIAGRFMNLSRKWTFGGSSRSTSGGSGSTKDNYDSQGFFRADAPEAIIRKLADYAFMLRDWKLAHSTYDLIRADYNDTKAWKYHAASNEMAAVTLLMMPQHLTAKGRSETIDAMLESAFYSYQTRCSSPYGALRSLILAIELLRLRGGTNIDDAGRWGLRLLESRILGPVGDALVKERLAIAYASKVGLGTWNWGTRQRKSAVWAFFAAEAWAGQEKYIPSQRCLSESERLYDGLPSKRGITGFQVASGVMKGLHAELGMVLDAGGEKAGESDGETEVEEESEALMDTRARRPSVGVPETARLHGQDEDESASKEKEGNEEESQGSHESQQEGFE